MPLSIWICVDRSFYPDLTDVWFHCPVIFESLLNVVHPARFGFHPRWLFGVHSLCSFFLSIHSSLYYALCQSLIYVFLTMLRNVSRICQLPFPITKATQPSCRKHGQVHDHAQLLDIHSRKFLHHLPHLLSHSTIFPRINAPIQCLKLFAWCNLLFIIHFHNNNLDL